MDEAAEAAEQRSHRHHADPHRGIPQPGGEALDLLCDRLDGEIRPGVGQLAEPGLGDYEFADAVHQLVQPLGLDADGGPLVVDPAQRLRPVRLR